MGIIEKEKVLKVIKYIILVIVAFLLIMIVGITLKRAKLKNKTAEVEAYMVNLQDCYEDENGDIFYKPEYHYEVNGNQYVYSPDKYIKQTIHYLAVNKTLYYNVHDLGDMVAEVEVSIEHQEFLLFILLLLMLAFTFAIKRIFKKEEAFDYIVHDVFKMLKPIDNTIKYHELLMKYEDTSVVERHELPDGFKFEFYKSGDELEWVNIHIESGEFTAVEEGLKYFHEFYNSFIGELDKRCIFIVAKDTGEKIGTATISLLRRPELNFVASVDWVAIKKRYQGRHLAKPLVTKFIEIANELGHENLMLHTQTTTWLAAQIYLDMGFEPVNTEEKYGWRILKTITDHEKLVSLKPLENEEILDKRNIQIEQKLSELYGTKDFNYTVWYKNKAHHVHTYVKETHYEYKYYEDGDGNITLEEIKTKMYEK